MERAPHEQTPENNEKAPALLLWSAELAPRELHRFGDLKTIGVEGVHLNAAHNQDAFAIKGDVGVVCDGVSSLESSGVLSRLFSESLAQKLQTSSVKEALSMQSVRELMKSAASSEEIEELKNKAAQTTAVAYKIDREAKSIEFGVVGDSLLIVADRNPQTGELDSFKLLTNRYELSSTEYTDPEDDSVLRLRYASPDSIGLYESGAPTLEKLERARFGSVGYVPGRVVIAATDFYTKLLARCPEVLLAEARGGAPLAKSVRTAQAMAIEELFADMWTKNPKTEKKTLNPLFFVGKKPEDISETLSGLMQYEVNKYTAVDDVTEIALDMDTLFTKEA